MFKSLSKFEPQAYFLLRAASGFMFAFHGAQKVLGINGAAMRPFGTQMWLGGVIELLSGLAIMVGLYTRAWAFLASGTMAVAYFQFHWKYQGGWDFFPTVNKGELAALYCFVFLLIACKGSGEWAMKKD